MKILKKSKPTIAEPVTKPAYDYNANGPKHVDDGTERPWIMFKSDWTLDWGLLWIRPNTEVQKNAVICSKDPDGTTPRYLGLEEITDFAKNASMLRHVVILTRNAAGPYPTNVSLTRDRLYGRVEIQTSFGCNPKDVDILTTKLVQAILDCWNVKADFEKNVDDWKLA